MKKHNNTKIGVGSIVRSKVGEFEEITRELISRRIRKEMVGCVYAVTGKKKFILKFKYVQNK